MTADSVPASAQSSETSAGDAGYESLAALRDGHLALKQSISESALPGAVNTAASIRAYLAKAREAGAFIADARERRSAQGILDYWSAELAGLPDAAAEDFTPLLLLPADSERAATATQGDRTESAATTANKETDRALIRLSAMARQWRDSDKQAGYLLSGETIEEAARFKDQDPNLAEFVEASQQIVERAKRIRRRVWSGIGVACVLLAGLGVTVWYTEYLKNSLKRLQTRIQTSGTVKIDEVITTLRRLDRVQPLSPPYDLSGLPKLTNINLPGLTLYAPNFAGVEFSKIGLHGANLPAATFSSANFSFDDGGGDNDFSEAELSLAQFRNAKIAFTSFAGANLYRAIFDRSILCEVNFSGANLRNASFWAVKLDDKTKDNLKKTAWWLAVGWPWSEIEKLAPPHQADRSKEIDDEKVRIDGLKTSSGFLHDIGTSKETLQHVSAGTLDRAVALNDMAWTDAVWGIDITAPKEKPSADPCAADGVPATAHDAAEQAVCIVGKLNSEGDKKGTQTDLLSSLRDTWAYVQMQSDEMAGAVKTFEELGRDDRNALEAGETSFRYAIAQYAVGQDKTAAVKRFKAAIEESRYQPTHELQTLRDYIFTVREFVDVLKNAANTLWPPIPNDTACPVRKSADAK